MSFRATFHLICDRCGEVIVGRDAAKISALASTYWELRRFAESMGWITLEQCRKRDRHFCQKCADKPIPKAKKLTPP